MPPSLPMGDTRAQPARKPKTSSQHFRSRSRALGLRGWLARSAATGWHQGRLVGGAGAHRCAQRPRNAAEPGSWSACSRWPGSEARRSIRRQKSRNAIRLAPERWVAQQGLESASFVMGKGGLVTYVASDFFKLIFQIRGSIFDNVLSSECLAKARCFAEQTTSRCSAAQRAGVCSE